MSRRQGRRDRQGEEDEDEEEEPDLSHRGGAGRAGGAARGTSTPARAAWPRPPRTARVWGSEDTLRPAALGDSDTAECDNFCAQRVIRTSAGGIRTSPFGCGDGSHFSGKLRRAEATRLALARHTPTLQRETGHLQARDDSGEGNLQSRASPGPPVAVGPAARWNTGP